MKYLFTQTSRTLFLLAILLATRAAAADNSRLTICYNFGCKSQASIIVSAGDLDHLDAIFSKDSDAAVERENIRKAIALMEQIAGRQSPTANDVGGNYRPGIIKNGQMDCIDESTNTTTYLIFLQHHGLLHWHKVEKRVFRAPFILDQHWAAQIKEIRSGRRFVVDSWFDDNGKPPRIQPLNDWLGKRPIQTKTHYGKL